ncbi:MAG TPA: LLM class flavin-dependent oxidoreductase [Candidatus Limnocylindria bacterium]|nr:LLM class flavin-dependent oxidoreductase [Candidatus Limnocylindria bacterium]
MEIGLGIDGRLALSAAEQADIAAEAAVLGYTSLWTPARDDDPFELCALWHRSSGLETGISVLPIQRWSAERLVASARPAFERTAGHFVLGVGAGTVRDAPIRRMRDLESSLRPALGAGRIYLGALGPQMLHLAGERYDGAALNWCSPQQALWSRERVAAGALAAGRDPRDIRIHQYIRLCVDPDIAAARQALAKMVLAYALNRPGGDTSKGYRGHFTRMGFDETLTELEALRDRGAGDDALAARLPDELLARVGWWGPPEGAAAGFGSLTAGLDVAVVRVVAAKRNDADCVRLAMRSCVRAS